MAKVIIIGSGPAGISAAIYTQRAGIETIIISNGTGALGKAHLIENYYGFEEPLTGGELARSGVEQAKRLGAVIIEDEVVGLGFSDGFIVETSTQKHSAEAVIIATGTQRSTPPVKGLKEFEGKGVSYCALCDAFFYRGADVAVVGNGGYALHEALELAPVVRAVTILTDGKPVNFTPPSNIQINLKKISEVGGNNSVEQISFDDGSILKTSGVFVALGVAGSVDLAKKIGAVTDSNRIVVDKQMKTNIPNLFAAGDCTGGLMQIAKAVSDGAIAGTEVIKALRKQK